MKKVIESYIYTKIQKDEEKTRKQYSRIIRVIEIKVSRSLKDHMGGQWAIHYGPLYEIFMVYGHIYIWYSIYIYIYGHNTIMHTCLRWYNSMIMRQKKNDIGEKDGREQNQEIFLDCNWYRRDQLWPISVSFPFSFSFSSSFILLIMVLLFLWTRRIHFIDDRAADINKYSLRLHFFLFSFLLPFFLIYFFCSSLYCIY